MTEDGRKRCRRCNVWKPHRYFCKKSAARDGLQSFCKECHKLKERRRRAADPARHRESVRLYGLRHPERIRASKTAYAAKSPEKISARGAVRDALLRGDLNRGPCEVCGDVKTEGHHDDYSQPLTVRWLCKKHHALHHRKECEEISQENVT